ncbi:MAG: thioesterase family protein [Gammaproteobacteria bacterium]
MNPIEQDSQFTQLAEDRWQLNFSDRWGVRNIPNGGYQMAAVARVLAEQVPHPHPLTVTGHYLRPASPGPAEVTTELLKAGKAMSTGVARLYQNDKQTLHITASYSDLNKTAGPSSLEVEAPQFPAPEECIPLSEVIKEETAIHNTLETLLDPACTHWGQGESAEFRVWMRFRDHSAPDLWSLLLFADAQPPPIFNLIGYVGWVPTVELTVHLHKPPAPGWLRARFRNFIVQNGILEEDGEIWDSTGELVAVSRQMGQVRMLPTES